MKLKRKCVSILVAISIAVMSAGCEKINNSNEIESYAAEEIEFNYDSETILLKQYPTFSKGTSIEFTYDFDCKEYEELLKKYPIEEIAGEGSEFERVLRLTHEYSGRLAHKSNYDNAIAENALALLEHSLDQPDNGINCRAKGEILNEMCLALGIYSRRVAINPYSAIDNDSHVVNEIFDTQRNKWIKYLELLLAAAKSKWDISDSMLYQHIKQKDGEESFTEHMIGGLLAGIQNDDSCTFLKTEPRFLEIVNKYNFLKRIDINVT
nr:hypothetical protein [uncultured Cellulosilyticum sp.]